MLFAYESYNELDKSYYGPHCQLENPLFVAATLLVCLALFRLNLCCYYSLVHTPTWYPPNSPLYPPIHNLTVLHTNLIVLHTCQTRSGIMLLPLQRSPAATDVSRLLIYESSLIFSLVSLRSLTFACCPPAPPSASSAVFSTVFLVTRPATYAQFPLHAVWVTRWYQPL